MTQRMTGVERYAHEIVASLDTILSEDGDIANRLGFRLILPGEVEVKPALSQIDVCQTKLGSGHAWLSARHRAFFPRMRRAISDPTFTMPAMLAMTTWLRSTRRRYVWHSRPRRRDLEFRRWRRWPGAAPSSPRMRQALSRWGATRSLMWIPITATAGATRSLAWQETWIFARPWRHGGEGEPRCFPGNAARGFTSIKSCACMLSRGLSYFLKISHAREAHIVRLRASARIQGHGDEPRRPYGVLSPACRIARSIRRIRLTVGPASKYRSLNSDMPVPAEQSCVRQEIQRMGSRNGSTVDNIRPL